VGCGIAAWTRTVTVRPAASAASSARRSDVPGVPAGSDGETRVIVSAPAGLPGGGADVTDTR